MDRNTKIICIIFVVIILGLAIYTFAPIHRSYSIENASYDLTVHDYGKLHVDEVYDYSFKGEYNGTYRNIPLNFGENISRLKVSAEGAYPVVEQSDTSGEKNLKIYLYMDSKHTQKVKDCDVRIKISYDMDNVVRLYRDIGTLQYKLWDKQWDVGVKNLYVTVHLPGDKNNTFYLDPEKFTRTSSLEADTITAKATDIPKGEIYELLVLMPRDDFYPHALWAQHIDANGKDEIISNHNESISSLNFWDMMLNIYVIIALAGPAILIGTYIICGREPKVDYDGIYEREIPSDNPPEAVNALFAQTSEIGTPDMQGFEASILNIIDKKVIDIKAQENEDLFLIFKEDRKHELSSSEQKVFDALSAFAADNVLNLSTLRKRLTNQSNAKSFMKKFNDWKKQVEEENRENVKRYFNTKGSKITGWVGSAGFFLALIMFFSAALFPTYNMRVWAMRIAVVVGIIGIISFFLPADYVGQWTPEGRVLHLKWKNFKNFLQDNSLIEQHPPQSIVIWKKYLIYGAALGVADNVYKSMKLQVPDINEYNDNVFMYHSFNGFSMMHSAVKAGQYSSNPSSSGGGSGGFGGGSGGGGGGAF